MLIVTDHSAYDWAFDRRARAAGRRHPQRDQGGDRGRPGSSRRKPRPPPFKPTADPPGDVRRWGADVARRLGRGGQLRLGQGVGDRGPGRPAGDGHPPPGGWQLVNVRELWRFRELLFFLAWRDVKVRYKQTVLGVAWAVLQPADDDGRVHDLLRPAWPGCPSGDVPYPLFAFAGLLPWTFFATAIADAGNSVVGIGAADHQDLLPAAGRPVRRGRGGGRRLRRSPSALLLVLMALVRGHARPGARCWPRSSSLVIAPGGARRRHAAGGPERRVPRLPVRDPVPGPVLDVRHADRLHAAAEPTTTRHAHVAVWR